MTELAEKEVYQGRISFEDFRDIHLDLWSEIPKKEGYFVFECIFFQNHIVELLGSHDLPKSEIENYLKALIKTVASMKPLLIYLTQDDLEKTIDRASKERVTRDKTRWKDWINLVIEYIDAMPYSKKRNQSGYDGVIAFFKDRKNIELSLLYKLDIEILKINNSDFDLEKVLKQVDQKLNL